MDKSRLVIEIVGDELVATTGQDQVYRKQWEYTGHEISAQVAAFAQKHLDNATHLTVVGPRLISDGVLGVCDAITNTTVELSNLQASLVGVTVDFTTMPLATAAWLASDIGPSYVPLQRDKSFRFDHNTDLSVVHVNLTDTDVLLQHCVVRNRRLAASDNWPAFMAPEHPSDIVSFAAARVQLANSAGVAIVFVPHPFHTAYGFQLLRAAQQEFMDWQMPAAMFTDAQATRIGVEVLARGQAG